MSLPQRHRHPGLARLLRAGHRLSDMPETWRLSETINDWWDEIEIFIETCYAATGRHAGGAHA